MGYSLPTPPTTTTPPLSNVIVLVRWVLFYNLIDRELGVLRSC